MITKRLSLDDKSKRDVLQSFIDHGLPLSALRQEVGLQLYACPSNQPLYTTRLSVGVGHCSRDAGSN